MRQVMNILSALFEVVVDSWCHNVCELLLSQFVVVCEWVLFV